MVTKRPQIKRWTYWCKVLVHPGWFTLTMRCVRWGRSALTRTHCDLTCTGKCSPLVKRFLSIWKTFIIYLSFRTTLQGSAVLRSYRVLLGTITLCHIRASPPHASKHRFSLNLDLAALLYWCRFCSDHFNPFKTFFPLWIWPLSITG